jgi:ubiquinone/menaquinone biosynthesis C-methylase UbiE/uncharacterized protein YbaR (Trm112 family)
LVASRYDAIKRFHPQNESWFVAAPLLRTLPNMQETVVLDVATGTGRLPLALLHERFRGKIIGLDLSQGMLRQAQRQLRDYGDQVYLLRHDADSLPFNDGVFEAVSCLESLEFMSRPLETLSEMVRVLAPGGTLMLTNRVGREARFLPGRALSRTQFQRLLTEHRLTEIHVRPWQSNYDLAIAHKAGERTTPTRAPGDFASLVCCPACHEHPRLRALSRARAAGFLCPSCERTYPVRAGVLQLADPVQSDNDDRR